jgi:ABC-type phosphate transport system substrate-binding protein
LHSRRTFLRALLPALLLTPCPVGAEEPIVVVVAANAGVDRLTQAEVTNIFLGRFKKLPSGTRAQPVDVTPLKEQFYARLVGKSLAEINAYWARLTFSGQTMPPRQESLAQAVELVATVPGAIAYVERRHVDRRLKVVFELAE